MVSKYGNTYRDMFIEGLKEAEAFPGALRFLWRAKHKGYQLFIVSHKTKFSHHDSTVNLREHAFKWLEEKNIYSELGVGLIERVYFLSTQKEKVETFNLLNLDVIIDDLTEVTEHPLLDEKINPIHFGGDKFPSWLGVENYLLGDINESDCCRLIQELSLGIPISCKAYQGGGNSSVWRAEIRNSLPLAIKFYHNDLNRKDRREVEAFALNFMSQYGVENIPKIVSTDKALDATLFGHIDAKNINKLDENKVGAILNFIEKLKVAKENSKTNHPLASAACLSGEDVVEQVNSRLFNLKDACLVNPDLDVFISGSFIPFFQLLIIWAKVKWPNKGGFRKPLDVNKQILTPSDLGVHNMMEDNEGNIYFIDFEYFGLDDPVKTTSDFLWHPKNKINIRLGKMWVINMVNLLSWNDPNFRKRLAVSWPLYGLCWCLIMLNEFHEINWQARMQAKGLSKSENSKIRLEQLTKSAELLNFIKSNYQEFPYLENFNDG